MSKFIVNQSCDMCHKIELGLVKMTIGNTEHHLCYKCMTIFTFDVVEFASHNLREEFTQEGYTINSEDNTCVIKPIERGELINETVELVMNINNIF